MASAQQKSDIPAEGVVSPASSSSSVPLQGLLPPLPLLSSLLPTSLSPSFPSSITHNFPFSTCILLEEWQQEGKEEEEGRRDGGMKGRSRDREGWGEGRGERVRTWEYEWEKEMWGREKGKVYEMEKMWVSVRKEWKVKGGREGEREKASEWVKRDGERWRRWIERRERKIKTMEKVELNNWRDKDRRKQQC